MSFCHPPCIILLYLHRADQGDELIILYEGSGSKLSQKLGLTNLYSNSISIATLHPLPGTSVEVMLARAALLALVVLSYLCPASYPLSGKSNTLNGERKHYDCNRTWNKISVSPITTFLHIVAVVEKPFTVSPVSAVFVISLEW